MLSDEEILKLVEKSYEDVSATGDGKLVFCKAADGKYYIATVSLIKETPPSVPLGSTEIKYFTFDYAELAVFAADMQRVLEEDKPKRSN